MKKGSHQIGPELTMLMVRKGSEYLGAREDEADKEAES